MKYKTLLVYLLRLTMFSSFFQHLTERNSTKKNLRGILLTENYNLIVEHTFLFLDRLCSYLLTLFSLVVAYNKNIMLWNYPYLYCYLLYSLSFLYMSDYLIQNNHKLYCIIHLMWHSHIFMFLSIFYSIADKS